MMMQRGGLAEVFGEPIDKAKWAREMPLSLVAAAKPGDWKGLRIYFDTCRSGSAGGWGCGSPVRSCCASCSTGC
jgi:hypothetical protein